MVIKSRPNRFFFVNGSLKISTPISDETSGSVNAIMEAFPASTVFKPEVYSKKGIAVLTIPSGRILPIVKG